MCYYRRQSCNYPIVGFVVLHGAQFARYLTSSCFETARRVCTTSILCPPIRIFRCPPFTYLKGVFNTGPPSWRLGLYKPESGIIYPFLVIQIPYFFGQGALSRNCFIETTRNANGNLSHICKLYTIEGEGAKRLHIRPYGTRECSDICPWPKSHDEQEISSAREYSGNFV